MTAIATFVIGLALGWVGRWQYDQRQQRQSPQAVMVKPGNVKADGVTESYQTPVTAA